MMKKSAVNWRDVVESQVTLERGRDCTLSELVASYGACAMKDAKAQKSRKWETQRLSKVVEAFGDISAWDVTPEQVLKLKKGMELVGYKNSTVNRNISSLGSLYIWAKSEGFSPEGFVSPTVTCPRLTEDIRRVHFTKEQIDNLVKLSASFPDRRFGVYVRLIRETGCRKSEVGERLWSDFNLMDLTITLMDTKTGKPRIVYFSQDTADIIRRIWTHRPPDVMPFSASRGAVGAKDYGGSWDKLTKLAGLEGMHIHDLRHNRASEMLAGGVSSAIVAQALGNSSKVLESRYGHLTHHQIEAHARATLQ
jgi:integrase